MNIMELQGAGPWPLCPTERESPVPNGLLLDIAVTGGVYDQVVYLDTLIWGGPIWGVCVVRPNRTPLAWFWSVEEPEAGRPYTMESIPGWSGLVMFGRHPDSLNLLGLGLKLDPRCLSVYNVFNPPIARLVVDGVGYPAPADGNIRIEASGYIALDSRRGFLGLHRADALLDEESRWLLFQDLDGNPEMEATSLAGVFPDGDGNVNIRIQEGAGEAWMVRAADSAGSTSKLIEYVKHRYVRDEDDTYFIEYTEVTQAGEGVGIVLRGDGRDMEDMESIGFARCSASEPERLLKCRTDIGQAIPLPLDYVNCPEDIICPDEPGPGDPVENP